MVGDRYILQHHKEKLEDQSISVLNRNKVAQHRIKYVTSNSLRISLLGGIGPLRKFWETYLLKSIALDV
jgi:hypothetical protein